MKSLYGAIPAVVACLFGITCCIFAWTEPTAIPPQDNVSSLINESSSSQSKAGLLSVKTLSVNDSTTPCCAAYYTVSINEGGANQPTLQFHDSGVAEGQMILSGDIGNGNRGFLFQSTQTLLDGRFTGSFFVDGNVGIGSAAPPAKLFVQTSDTLTVPLRIDALVQGAGGFFASPFESWAYRVPITITNPNSSTLTNFQIKVTLNTSDLISSGKMLSTCADIRVSDSDGTTSLNHWVSGCNSSFTYVWVKVPSIPASSSKVVYIYYGNSFAASQSNPASVFVFYDDFDDGNISDWSLWTDCGTGAKTVSNTVRHSTPYSIKNYVSNTCRDSYSYSYRNFTVPDTGTYTVDFYAMSGPCDICTIYAEMAIAGSWFFSQQLLSLTHFTYNRSLTAGSREIDIGMYTTESITGTFPAYFDDIMIYKKANTSPAVANGSEEAAGPVTPFNQTVLIIKENTGNLGIGTDDPGADKLEVNGRAYASGGWQTVNADYAEWFEKEESTAPGDIIGINLDTGKVRKYRIGDKFLGIHSANPSFVGNRLEDDEKVMERDYTLVSLMGQVEFDYNQVVISKRKAFTPDGQAIGVVLSNKKLLIKK